MSISKDLRDRLTVALTSEDAAAELISLLIGSVTIPNGSTEITTPYQDNSSSYVDIPGFDVDITIDVESQIYASMNYTASSPSGGSCEADFRMVINSSPEQNSIGMHVRIQNNTDDVIGAGRLLTNVVPPGSYNVRVQMRRTTGNGSLQFERGVLFLQAQSFSKV